jgi:DNA topoisomerase VI subunit B
MEAPKPPHSMCITVRLDADTLTELLAESSNNSLSKVLNEKVKRVLAMLIEEAHERK